MDGCHGIARSLGIGCNPVLIGSSYPTCQLRRPTASSRSLPPWKASGRLTVLNDRVLDTLPAAPVGRPFTPALASTVVVLWMPAVQPNAHAETLAQLLHEEARQHLTAPLPGPRARVSKATQRI